MKWLDGYSTRLMFASSILAIMLGGIGPANGTTITVGPGAGYDFDSIQAGIDAAVDSDTVLVAAGEYVITEPISFQGKAITVMSEAGRDETTIRMGTPADTNRGSVVIFENGEIIATVLDGFTITGGSGCRVWVAEESRFARGGGGICFVSASSATVRNCAVVQNAAEIAGGVGTYSSGSSATLKNCIINGNTAEFGGGVACSYDSSVTITDCIVSENHSQGDIGGGVAAWYGSVSMTDCAIMSNTAMLVGGGFYVGNGSATLTGCIIASNTVAWGGGGVACSLYGGTDQPEGTSPTITNCTIWGNSGGEQGGGVGCYHGASVTLTNSIIWANTAQRGRNISLVDRSALGITYSDVGGGRSGVNVEGGCTLNWGVGNIDTDPLFVRLDYLDDKGTPDPSDDVWVEDDFHLKSQAGRWDPDSQTWVQDDVTSPCIDVGDPMNPIGWEHFPNGGFINMGAYGGTPKASKSYFGEPICETIIAGDINGDGHVNRTDLEIMALHWTDDVPLPLP